MKEFSIPGYEIIEPIGEGGMGTVYKARQVSLGRLVAIKVLRDDLAADPSALAQFKLEANSVANLKHPNIVLLHEAGELDGRHYFVMEYVAAYSVQDWLSRKGRISESDALTIADAVAHALQYAWDRAGLVHCDIKPGNLLVDEDGIIKVADFSGISREMDTPESRLVAEMTIGTPNYMAPEQARGIDDLDCRADIYALGSVLYHLLSGRLPFANLSPAETMQCQVTSHLPDPREDAPEIGAPMVRLIERLLIKDPAERPQNWQAVRDDLRQVHKGKNPAGEPPAAGASTLRCSPAPTRADPQSPPPVKRRVVVVQSRGSAPARSRNRKRRIAALLGVVIGLIAANAYLAYRIWERRRPELPEPDPAPEVTPPSRPVPVEPTPRDPAPTRPEPAPRPPPITRPDRPAPAQPAPPAPSEARPPAVVDWWDTPAAADPAEPDPPAAAADPDAFLAMLRIHRTALEQARRGHFDSAEQTLREWHDQHRDRPHARSAAESARWLRRAGALGRLLERQADALVGHPLPGRPAEGEIIEAARGHLRLRRVLGPGGTAEISIPYHEIGSDDMLALLKRADPEEAPLHAATYLLALGRLTAAEAMIAQGEDEGLNTDDLQEWLEAWKALSRNIAAERQFQEAERLLRSHQFEACRTAVRALRDEWAETDIVRSVRHEDLRRIDQEAAESIRRIPRSAPAQDRRADEADSLRPDAVEEDSEDDELDIEGHIINMVNIQRRLRQLDGRVVRIRALYRSPIDRTADDRLETRLGDNSGEILAVFPTEGRRAVHSLPLQRFHGEGRRFSADNFYGRVDAESRRLVLLGRTRRTHRDPRSAEYEW